MSDQESRSLRHDTADLFRLQLLAHSNWAMTPCVVRIGGEWRMIRHECPLLCLSDDVEVLCPWPGKARQDLFAFTVGDFRKAHALAGKVGPEGEGGGEA
jgi:hypothetical protein